MTTIDPVDFLEKLKEKDQDDFEDAALMIADYIQDKPEMVETYRDIINLVTEPPIVQSHLSLVVNHK